MPADPGRKNPDERSIRDRLSALGTGMMLLKNKIMTLLIFQKLHLISTFVNRRH
jgi:hypothetical protein